jgi:hypothetical protein
MGNSSCSRSDSQWCSSNCTTLQSCYSCSNNMTESFCGTDGNKVGLYVILPLFMSLLALALLGCTIYCCVRREIYREYFDRRWQSLRRPNRSMRYHADDMHKGRQSDNKTSNTTTNIIIAAPQPLSQPQPQPQPQQGLVQMQSQFCAASSFQQPGYATTIQNIATGQPQQTSLHAATPYGRMYSPTYTIEQAVPTNAIIHGNDPVIRAHSPHPTIIHHTAGTYY